MDPNDINFSRLGFTEYQEQDLRIILSLTTPELMQEWVLAVGEEDALYGLGLVECAALTMLDEMVEDMQDYPEAMAVIDQVRGV